MKMQKSSRRHGFFYYLFITLFRLFLLALIAAAGVFIWALADMPEITVNDFSPHGYRTSVRDDAGEEILILAGQESNRIHVALSEISPDLRNAFIAIEDERFYQHYGIDLRGIFRAIVRDISTRSFSQGASTITQQLIKNNIFAGGMESSPQDKVKRKLQELYLAVWLEQTTSKSWILENYLNTINLGAGTFGVQTAALRYFGKDASRLTLGESAVIAAITRNPSAYNPLRYPEQNRERQLLVLSRMLECNLISQQRYEEAVDEDVYSRLQDNPSVAAVETFSYFEDAAILQVIGDMERYLGYSNEQAWNQLYYGGLTIETTQNTRLQNICEEEINRSESESQATAVMIDPLTGAVKAVVGGRGEKNASLTLNRAISGVRQPGSTIKILGEYAAAFQSGTVTLGTVYDDAPTSYSDGTPIRNATGSYSGRISIRQAVAGSVNTVALRCFRETGLDTVWKQLQAFGLSHLDEYDRVEALALGGTHGGVTNLELTAAYAAIAAGGMYTEPYYYTRVLSRDGTVLLQKTPLRHEAVNANTAALLTSALESVMDNGTGVEAAFPGYRLAGKTGTTSDWRDLWMVGFSRTWVCGVWNGFDDYSAQDSSSPVKQLWREIMRRAHETVPEDKDIPFPQTEILQTVSICAKCGGLAVEGLCDHSVQGDMIREEFYVPGTAPFQFCDCHVKVDICTSSGELAGMWCPERTRTERVYLREGTEGTADAEAVVPEASCSVHQNWRDWLLPDGQNEENPDIPDDSHDTRGREHSHERDNDDDDDDGEDTRGRNGSGRRDDSEERGHWWDDWDWWSWSVWF